MKKFAWSYSALDSFHLCPRKHYHEKIAKTYPFKSNAAADYGKMVHKSFEDYVLKKKPLPLDVQHHKKFLDAIVSLGDSALGEQKLALTNQLKPTGWFDDDVWCRSIIDLTVIKGEQAIICDYKTGKPVDSFDQVDHQAAMLSVLMPELKTITSGYYYTKSKTMQKHTLQKDDMKQVWVKFWPRVKQMEEMIAEEQFPAKQNFLCKSYCPVKSCQFNGG